MTRNYRDHCNSHPVDLLVQIHHECPFTRVIEGLMGTHFSVTQYLFKKIGERPHIFAEGKLYSPEIIERERKIISVI